MDIKKNINILLDKVLLTCTAEVGLAIKALATADLVEAVRCKDCVHRRTRPHCAGRPMDWYCPEGVRRQRND